MSRPHQSGKHRVLTNAEKSNALEMNPDGSFKSKNTVGAMGVVSRWQTAATGTVYYAYDERGDTAQRTGGTGNVLSSTLVDAYGKLRYQGATQIEPYDGFMAQSGYWRSTTIDLYTATYRIYDPGHGRWFTRD